MTLSLILTLYVLALFELWILINGERHEKSKIVLILLDRPLPNYIQIGMQLLQLFLLAEGCQDVSPMGRFPGRTFPW